MPKAQHLPLNVQLFGMHQLIFEPGRSCLPHPFLQSADQQPNELAHMECEVLRKFHHRSFLHLTKSHEFCAGSHQIAHLG